MRNKFFVLACLLAVMFSAPVRAEVAKVESVKLFGKTEIWLSQQRDLPLVVIDIAFRDAGSSSDSAGKEGRARMLAALLDEGAGRLHAKEFQKMLEEHAIKMSFGVDDDVLSAHVETLSEHLPKAMELLGLALSHPRFDESAMNRVRAQMLAAYRQMQQDPNYLAGRELKQLVFGKHPYANPAEGTEDSIKTLNYADLQTQLKQSITKANMLVAVAGDVTPKEIQTLFNASFADLPENPTASVAVPDIEVAPKQKISAIDYDQPQTVIMLAGQGIARSDKDFYAAYVLNHLPGGGTLTSKLGDEIREKNGLAYYAYTALQPMEHASLFFGSFGTRNEKAPEALMLYLKTLKDVGNGHISEKELNEAKQYLMGAFPLSLDSNEKLSSMILVMQRFQLGKDYLQKRNQIIANIHLEDIKRVAKRMLSHHNLAIVAIGKPDEEKLKATLKP